MKIGIISDTHGYLDDSVIFHLKECDEIWHAGDIGSTEVFDTLNELKPLRAVYGNIDDQDIRLMVPEIQKFEIDRVQVMMKHIGGYPGRYDRTIKNVLFTDPPDIFISGHSHICKIMPDKKLNLLHINPGALGKMGMHKFRTLVLIEIINSKITGLNVVELGKR
jgi:uncharacterized protein